MNIENEVIQIKQIIKALQSAINDLAEIYAKEHKNDFSALCCQIDLRQIIKNIDSFERNYNEIRRVP